MATMATDFDADPVYLQPEFDASSLTMPQLRNILVEHQIAYPSGAKKGQLVEIFENQLKPRAKRILSQRARVRRTSKGITDIPSQETATGAAESEDTEEEATPVPKRRSARASATPSVASRTSRTSRATPALSTTSRTSRKSGRTSSRHMTEDEDEAEASTGRRSSSRRSTATPMPDQDEEDEAPKAAKRKTRLSDFDAPEQVKEESTDERVLTADGESPFTRDNPFQQGGLPMMEEYGARKKTPARKSTSRKTAERSTEVKVKRERSVSPVKKTRKVEIPLSAFANGVTKETRSRSTTVEPSEEFTPEEQQALEREEAVTGKQVMPARRKQPRSSAAKTGPWIVLTTILAGVGGWWRQEKIAAGYCGIGSSGQTVSLSNSNVALPEWLGFLQPVCEPCPQHAYCYADFEARCEPDFLLKNHPLSLGGLVPLTPTCEPDGEKARKVKAVADRAVEELREQKARYECGGKDEAGQSVTSPEVREETLKAKVSAKRRRGMSEAEFEDLWKPAIGEIKGREEVTSNGAGRRSNPSKRSSSLVNGSSDGGGDGNSLLASTSLARLPLGCAARRSARLALARHRIPLASLVAVIAASLYARSVFLARRTDKARIPGLVSTVLDRLATQAALHAEWEAACGGAGSRAAGGPEPWISAHQLRDDVLRDEFSAERRERIWRRVRAVVEVNANVRAGVREGRSGDVSRVWEWTGAVPALEDASGYASDRRMGAGGGGGRGRQSLGGWVQASRSPSRGSSPMVAGGDAAGGAGGGDGARQVRSWDEGRPVY